MVPRLNERKHRRYDLKYPVNIRFGSSSDRCELEATSVNVSVGGMLLETTAIIPERTPVSFLMTLEGGEILRPIQLVGDGHVVRVESIGSEPKYGIAVKCDKPISEIETYLAPV
jgi:PilZ domain